MWNENTKKFSAEQVGQRVEGIPLPTTFHQLIIFMKWRAKKWRASQFELWLNLGNSAQLYNISGQTSKFSCWLHSCFWLVSYKWNAATKSSPKIKFMFSKKAIKLANSSPLIWQLIHNVKSTVVRQVLWLFF